MLKIECLNVEIDNKEILKGINLEVNKGEIHAIMGPNGSGKSTLTQTIAGREEYKIRSGSISYKGMDLSKMAPEIRAREGIFAAFQYPIEIPGVNNTYFLRTALNAIRKHKGLEDVEAFDFLKLVKKEMKEIGMSEDMLRRSVNEGFSGGEKKRNEILQLSILQPDLAILDETDSGLDIDALKIVSEGVNRFHGPEKSIILITHYQRLLDYIKPDFVHVLSNGRIIKSGGSELALELEERGYDWLNDLSEAEGECK
ncbi:MAG: Fe-S cluster assembly ATPase SufC [Candidatus Aminicenantes bacterium]|nr:Fe-S cluster assembly ATPase SufC [Candidatus Aminicenantes bacterium]